MKRGEIWTVAGGADYTGKRRPAIILQNDKFDATSSIAICPLTGTLVDAEFGRFAVAPSKGNGLQAISHAMVDKISTVPKRRVGRRLGRLERSYISLLNQHTAILLGLAD